MELLQCPVCGSTEVDSSIRRERFDVPFSSKTLEVELVRNFCMECEMDGDFNRENDSIVRNALMELRHSERQEILTHLKDLQITPVHMQRVLDLDFNKEWDNSRTGSALLRIIRAFPWLLTVADKRYDADVVAGINKKLQG